MKMFFRIFNNSRGITAVELMVSAALMGGISLFVAQSLKNQKNVSVNVEKKVVIEQSTRVITNLFKKQDVCKQTIGQFSISDLQSGVSLGSSSAVSSAGTSSITIDDSDGFKKDKEQGLRALNKIMASSTSVAGVGGVATNGGVRLKDIKLKLGGATGRVPLDITLTYEAKSKVKNEGYIEEERKLSLYVFIDGASNVKCNQYADEDIASDSLEKICDEVGGTMVSSKCQVDTISADLSEKIRTVLCKSLNKGNSNLNGSLKCNKIDVASVNMKNISSWFVDLGDGKRVKFIDEPCGSNKYLKGFDTKGNKICKSVPAPAFGAVDPSLGCTKPTTYSLSADKKTCTQTAYDKNCKPVTSKQEAASCKIFMAGTCEDYTGGAQVPSNEEGCGPEIPDPEEPEEPISGGLCGDGTGGFDSLANCEADGSTCSTVNLNNDGSLCTPGSSTTQLYEWEFSSHNNRDDYGALENECTRWVSGSSSGNKSTIRSSQDGTSCTSPGTVLRGCSAIGGSDANASRTFMQLKCVSAGTATNTSSCPVQKYCKTSTPEPSSSFTCPSGSAAYDSLSACQASGASNCEQAFFNNDGSTCSPSSQTTTTCSSEVVKTQITFEEFSAVVYGGTSHCGNLNNLSCSESGEVQGAPTPYCVTVGNYRRSADPKYYKLSCNCQTTSSPVNNCAKTKYCGGASSAPSGSSCVEGQIRSIGGAPDYYTKSTTTCCMEYNIQRGNKYCSEPGEPQYECQGGEWKFHSCASNTPSGGNSGPRAGGGGGNFQGGRLPEEMKGF